MTAAKSMHLWIILAIALYLFFSLAHLGLPGLHYDEVNFANAALGDVDGSFVAWSCEVFGKKLPLMVMKYIGAVKSALYAPIFRLFGTSAITVRLPVVFIGLFTLWASYALFRRMFNRSIALAGLLLFATDPTFIFTNRLDWGPVSLMLALELSSLYFLWRWMSEGNRYFIAFSGFLLGLGLYNKIIFIWYIAALFIAMLLFFREKFRQLLNWRHLICFMPAFIIGCLPLIAFNIAVPLGTFRGEEVLTDQYAESLIHRYRLYESTLDGSVVYYFMNQEDLAEPIRSSAKPAVGKLDSFINALADFPSIKGTLTPFAILGSAIWILFGGRYNRSRKKREILFLLSQLILIAGFICLSANATGSHHVLAFYPFLFIVVAYAVCELAASIMRSEAAEKIMVSVCLAAMVFPQLIVDARYLKSFVAYGGVGVWSDAIYELFAFTRQHPDKNFILMEWGFNTQLALLSGGHIQKEEFVCEQQNLESCLEPLTARTNSYLVFHVPPFESSPVLHTFKQVLARHHLQDRAVKTFYQRDGRPIYIVNEIVSPKLEAYRSKGDYFLLREGEDCDPCAGGCLDLKGGASNNKALGNFWGRRLEDFAAYRFTLPHAISDVHLYLRYAYEDRGPYQFNLFLDGNLADTLTIPPTQGFGYTAEQWKVFEVVLGDLAQGDHELKLRPAKPGQTMNVDYWYLCEGRFELNKDPPK